MRSEQEIDDTMNKAVQQKEENPGGKWPGMTYEDGVDAALRWVTEQSDENPMED